MTQEIIERYLSDVLKPQLVAFNATNGSIQRIITSVQELMLSCVFHWNDVLFRKTILVVGEEEGSFYHPKADLDIRSFVVVTVRNSAIESIHSDSYVPVGQNKRLTPDDIKTITSAAIEYFKCVDFSAVADLMGIPENDIYSELARKYPVSWAALTALANSGRQIIDYDPVMIASKPNLNILMPHHAVSGLLFEEDRSKMIQVTSDGYSLTIDHGLQHILESVIDNKLPFVSDSFKGISRNIEKLLAIMEYIMGNELGFITTNYLIANGYIERRLKPLKPGHDIEGMKRNWSNDIGVTKRHRSWLQAAAES